MSFSNEWCTKKQASKIIGRTERTVSRVVRDAVENRTESILANLKLVYANGKEIPGAEVTRDLLASNEEEGSRTRWFFRTVWWRDDYAPRINSEEDADPDSLQQPKAVGDKNENSEFRATASPGEPPPLPIDPTTRAVVLEHLHYSDRKHAAELRELTDRVLQVVETNQQLQGQTNTLYNQFQDALQVGGGLRALVEGASQPPAARPEPEANPVAPNATVVDIQPPGPSKTTAKASVGKAARPKPKRSPPAKPAAKDRFPTFRKLARYLRRK